MTKNKSLKIAFLLSGLGFGGGERVALNLAEALKAKGYNIDFVLMCAEGELLEYALQRFYVVDLKCSRTWQLPMLLALYLLRARPAALISSFWKLNLCACIARVVTPRIRVALWEHSPPSRSGNSPTWAYFLTASLLYRLATRVITVSRGVENDVRSITLGLGGKILTVYNAVPGPPRSVVEMMTGPGRRIVWVGRFADPKNPFLMLDAFGYLASSEELRLDFIGTGPLRSAVEARACELAIDDKVRFLGFQPDPYEHMAGADLLVVSSDREGLPTVLIEALYVGLALVSTDCGAGAREILQEGKYGAIVPTGNAHALAEAIGQQLAHPPEREHQREGAFRFEPSLIAFHFLSALGLDTETA